MPRIVERRDDEGRVFFRLNRTTKKGQYAILPGPKRGQVFFLGVPDSVTRLEIGARGQTFSVESSLRGTGCAI